MPDRELTIPLKSYRKLKESDLMLSCLLNAGVDNWVGYDEAMDSFTALNDSLFSNDFPEDEDA